MSQQEEWRTVTGFPDYQVSSLGRVLSRRSNNGGTRPPRFLRPGYTAAGYPTVVLCRDGLPGGKTHYVHLLVAGAFIGPRPEGQETRHLDGDPSNCVLSNLCYGSSSDNNLDQVRHGTHHWASATQCKRGHEFTEANTRRSPSRPNRRNCRACESQRRRDHRTAAAFRAAGIDVAA